MTSCETPFLQQQRAQAGHDVGVRRAETPRLQISVRGPRRAAALRAGRRRADAAGASRAARCGPRAEKASGCRANTRPARQPSATHAGAAAAVTPSQRRTARRPTPPRDRARPEQRDEQPDVRHVGITVRHGLPADLHDADHRHQRSQKPAPAHQQKRQRRAATRTRPPKSPPARRPTPPATRAIPRASTGNKRPAAPARTSFADTRRSRAPPTPAGGSAAARRGAPSRCRVGPAP